jgi:hypothetical protein
MAKQKMFPPRVWVGFCTYLDGATPWRPFVRRAPEVAGDKRIASKHPVEEYLSLAEHEARLAEALAEAAEWERLANEWREDYDKLKAKYEPMIAVVGEALSGVPAREGETDGR